MECGERLDRASAIALAGERKQVTVLFADVEGSMALGAQLDTEVWRAVMDRFFGLVCSAVNGCEGTVDKFTGDGAMALFGAPRAQEDHARKACSAALRLQAEIDAYAGRLHTERGIDLKVRIGLSSGEAIVGAIGADAEMAYTAIGPAVGLAARMEQIAEPGRPCMTRETADLVQGFFELESIGDRTVKGVDVPVEVFALIGPGRARTALDAARTRGFSRFVGRDHELAVLEQALARGARAATVVGVVGEPGVGKSRLCGEFLAACRSRGVAVTVGRGDPNGRAVPLLPVLEMLRELLGIESGQDARSVREQVSARLTALDEGFAEVLSVVYDVLGVAEAEGSSSVTMDPDARGRMLFGVVRRLLQARSGGEPSVILVEDAHWLDPVSDAFLEQLVASLPGSSTLLVVTFRPEYRPRWAGGSHYQQLPIVELTDESVGNLLASLVGTDPSIDGLADLVIARCGGNPLFVEELIRELVANGSLIGERGAYRMARPIDRIDVPGTVKVVIAARIDRLEDSVKEVVQAAAVVGGEFGTAVLARVTGYDEASLSAALDALVRSELVQFRSAYPEGRYAFSHALVEDVAYESQLSERRAALHDSVADAVEATYPDRLDELAAVVARHRKAAGDPLRAAHWTARAAVWAGQGDIAEGMRRWEDLRALLAGREEDEEAANLLLGACMWTLQFAWRVGMPRERVDETLAQAERICLRTGNLWALAAAKISWAVDVGFAGAVAEALEAGLEAKRLVDEVGDPELQLAAGINGYWRLLLGDAAGGLADTEAALAVARDDVQMGRAYAGFSYRVYFVFQKSIILMHLGRLGEARAALDQARDLAAQPLLADDIEVQGWIASLEGWLAYFTGVTGSALEDAQSGYELAARRASTWSAITASYGLAIAHLAHGNGDDALLATRRALALVEDAGVGVQDGPLLLGLCSESHLLLGDPATALAEAEEGLRLARRQGLRLYETYCRLGIGRALAQTDPDASRGELLSVRDEPGTPALWRPMIELELSRLAGTDPDERRRLLESARERFADAGASGWVERLDGELAAVA
jgi:class 3 adenylate cyclase